MLDKLHKVLEIIIVKNIVFSFDDARLDTYTTAYPILKKYGFPFTVNAVSDFVSNEEHYTCFASGSNKSMTREQLIECQNEGNEIACHGHNHKNEVQGVLDNIEALAKFGLDKNLIVGFASPNSYVTERNTYGMEKLVENGVLKYVRSGIQIRREGLIYTALSLVERITHSKLLFRYLNRKNIISNIGWLLPSVAITRYTTVNQVMHLIDKLKDGESVILMFHSVLNKIDVGYGKDDWYFDAEKFDEICKRLKENDAVNVCTTAKLVSDGIGQKL